MHCLVFVIATLFICEVSAPPPIWKIIKTYYESQHMESFNRVWEIYRRPMQNAVKTALAETAGLPGMNVYIRKQPEKIALSYIHDDNQVNVIFSNLYLKGMPRCRMPDLQFSLPSNVIKIETELSTMIIHADYSLVRNQDHIIHETPDQDSFKNSPFLFVQVEDVGKIAIRVDGCVLNGFIIPTLVANSVNLGYDCFKLINCVYTVEIYNHNQSSLPVIAKYNLDQKGDDELGLTELLLRPLLTGELIPKIQGAVFSFVNTSVIFGNTANTAYTLDQQIVFQKTHQYMTNVIRALNEKSVNTITGSIIMEDFSLKWDDENEVRLKGMELFGLDTMYLAHSGGPVSLEHVKIVDEIRYSSLQVRGSLLATSKDSEALFEFAAEISDLIFDIHLDEQHWTKVFTLLGVKEMRRMVVTLSSVSHGSEESLIYGYLLNKVPKVIHKHLSEIIPSAANLQT